MDDIKTSPKEAHRLMDGGTHVRHDRHAVRLSLYQGLDLSGQ